jgi:cell division protein FtsB
MATPRTQRSRRRPGRRPRRSAAVRQAAGVRWDRVGRVALLLVLGLILLLYVGPARSYWTTWQEAKNKRAEVQRLREENVRLRARKRALRDPRTLEVEARRLGMTRPGERPFVVEGLPPG